MFHEKYKDITIHLLFSMMTPVSWLERNPTYKEKQEEIKEKDLATYGFLGYPFAHFHRECFWSGDFFPLTRDVDLRKDLPKEAAPEAARVVKDAHGNVLADGDSVTLIKDLKLGGSSVLKGGSKSKPIKLVDGDHEISCKVDGIAVGLKACFVKKA